MPHSHNKEDFMNDFINIKKIKFLIPGGFLFFSACSTTSNRQKTLALTAAAVGAGYMIGQQKQNNKEANSLLYAGILGTTAAVGGMYIFDEEKRSEEIRAENLRLKTQLDEFDHATGDSSKYSYNSIFTNTDIPDDVKSLIRPGQVKTYKLNQWVREGSNRLVLKTDVIEFIEPKLIPQKTQ